MPRLPVVRQQATAVPAKGWQMPDTLLIVFGVLLVCALLTLFMPRGQFETRLDAETGRQLLVAGSYQQANNGEAQPAALFADGDNTGLLTAFFDGMTSGSRSGSAIGVVVFILLVGGSPPLWAADLPAPVTTAAAPLPVISQSDLQALQQRLDGLKQQISAANNYNQLEGPQDFAAWLDVFRRLAQHTDHAQRQPVFGVCRAGAI